MLSTFLEIVKHKKHKQRSDANTDADTDADEAAEEETAISATFY